MSTKNIEKTLGDWISQAEAARLRDVSRQAISKLVQAGRVRSLVVAGRTLVNRSDVLTFKPGSPGRPKGRRGDKSATR